MSQERKPRLPVGLLNDARRLRHETTDAEQFLWRVLRDRRMAEKKFRRQHPIGRYIVDFYCHEARLAIEVDGGQHDETEHRVRDEERDLWLAEQGIRVLRFWNTDVFLNTQGVLQTLWEAITEEGPSPQPSPKGRGRTTADDAEGE